MWSDEEVAVMFAVPLELVQESDSERATRQEAILVRKHASKVLGDYLNEWEKRLKESDNGAN
ncbi:MAG: hypothetical protein GY832_22260 [Chloroflexi bacterium]|nr:hypothetical protein [Chloroflexota bacterium]